jgi:nuclear factor erythroid 2
MDLIEVLWKQDVDLGFTLTPPSAVIESKPAGKAENEEDIEKLKALLEIENNKVRIYSF